MTDFRQYISICNEQQLTFLLLKKYMTELALQKKTQKNSMEQAPAFYLFTMFQ
jgi:hypothetical protein